MTSPALRLMIGASEFHAIGHVAAQWAYLETEMDYVLNVLANQPKVKEQIKPLGQAFKRRMAALKKSAKLVLANQQESLTELLSICEDASSLRGLRDDIVHGHWKLYRERGKGPLTTGVQVLKQLPSFQCREMPFSAEKGEQVAAKISHVNLRLIKWRMANIPSSSSG